MRAWIHRQCCFVGAPPRYLMACVFVCLGIRSSATVLVSLLLVAACGAGVPAFHIEPTGEAHIPVVIIFYWVGRCAGWLKGRRRDAKCCRWNVERGGRGCWGKVLWYLSPAVAVVTSRPTSTPASSPALLVLLVWHRWSWYNLLLSWGRGRYELWDGWYVCCRCRPGEVCEGLLGG